ncbi:hypothetical protein LUZ60_015330 [Juncus effusus]|nr:hypothetical protein LUZ60_015330 [Juncus effusus]
MNQSSLFRIIPSSIHDSISTVRSALANWDSDTSLSPSFLQATTHLHSYLVSSLAHSSTTTSTSHDDQLIPTISLLKSSIDHLKLELELQLNSISAVNSSCDEISTVRIIQTMISTGYSKECITIYNSIRKSKISSNISKLGFSPTNYESKNIRKIKWDILGRQIKSWIDIIPVVVQSIFSNEQNLCDKMFLSLDKSARDDIFYNIVSEKALEIFNFPESVSLLVKPSEEKLFSFLDIYGVITTLLPEIKSIFESESNQSMNKIILHAISSLEKLSEIIKSIILDLESSIKKDPLKSTKFLNGSIHPLSKYVMNYLVFLSDYEIYLHEIFSNMPSDNYESSFMEIFEMKYESLVSKRIAWIIFVLLCKIDSKAASYKHDVPLSYLFLTNNLQYIITKVQKSGLKDILGDTWLNNHIAKSRKYMESHLKAAWSHESALIPTNQEDLEKIREFEREFEKVMKEREGWVIADVATREQARLAVREMIVPVYDSWYQNFGEFLEVKFSTEDLRGRIMRLYDDGSDSGSSKFRNQFGRD